MTAIDYVFHQQNLFAADVGLEIENHPHIAVRVAAACSIEETAMKSIMCGTVRWRLRSTRNGTPPLRMQIKSKFSWWA